MATVKTEETIKKALLYLSKDDKTTRIFLTGEHGIGKTWTARKVLEQARKSHDPKSNQLEFGFTLWLSMNNKFDKFSLYRKVSSQLFLSTNHDEDVDHGFEWEEQANDSKEKMIEKFKKTLSAKLADKRYLLIIDGDQNGINGQDLISELEAVLPPLAQMNRKILITKTESDEIQTIDENNIQPIDQNDTQTIDNAKVVIKIEPLAEEESLKLLLEVISQSEYESQHKFILQICNGRPDKIIVIANLLRFILAHDLKNELGNLEAMLTEREGVNDYQKVTQFLTGYLARFQKTDMNFECSWYSRRIFGAAKCSIHYNDLITYWMLEGCLGDVDEVDKVYAVGHAVLMTLVNRGLLTKHEDNFVDMNRLFLEVNDNFLFGIIRQPSIGLENVFEDKSWEGFGKISKSIKKEVEFDKKVKTLLIDWHRLCKEVPESLFQRFLGIRVLALFNPTYESIPSSFSSLRQLNVLVFRGCPFLKNIDAIKTLDQLLVFEVTGAASLEEMPDTLFENMSKLCTIIFSVKNIKSIPSTISNQHELRRLILRGCSALEALPSVSKLTKLEIIDLSGAESFTKFNDRSFGELAQLQHLDISYTKVETLPILKQLKKLTKLLLRGSSVLRLRCLDDLIAIEIIDISNSKVSKEMKEDVFANKTALRTIKFPGTKIEKFPLTSSIQKLEIIDLSDNHMLTKFADDSLEHLKFLRILNVSKTSIEKLPSLLNLHNLCSLRLDGCLRLKELPVMKCLTRLEDFDLSNTEKIERIEHLNHENLQRLFLRGCVKLQKLPSLKTAQKLEVLDLSGCEGLTELEDASFEHLTQLKKLNLSKTMIETLPSLSNLTNLVDLSLRECTNLKSLPPLESLTSLEKLDLSGANLLGIIQGDQFLQHMNHLQVLNFSGIAQVTLTSMSNLPKLTQLILQGCSELNDVSGLEMLSELQILDLSATKISSLPPLSSLTSLQKLLLRDSCNVKELKELKFLTKLEALDLFGTGLKDFPYEISGLSYLNQLHLPKINGYQVDWEKIKWLPKEVNVEECGIFGHTETPNQSRNNYKLSVTLTSTKLLEFFTTVPTIWETYFKKFQISLKSPEHIADSDSFLFNTEDDMFQYIYNAHFRKSLDHHRRCLEIRGFDTVPESLNDVLKYANFVSITDNKFNNSLHELVGDNNIKHFWIERCNEAEYIFNLERVDRDARSMGGLEILCVSNMAKMKSVIKSDESLRKESFKKLKELYLDCCPRLVSLFDSDNAPENLEIIHIKFCDKLEALFGDKMYRVQKLSKLNLLHLPQLKTVGYKLQSLENLKTLRIDFCDKLETVSEENEFEMPTLQNLHLDNLPMLKNIGRVQTTSLQIKSVKECPLFPIII